MKKLVNRTLKKLGYKVQRIDDIEKGIPVEFSNYDREVIKYVLDNNLTMSSVQRLVATINACKHAVEQRIPGDFAECGVWRGGHSLAAKLTFENLGSDKKVYLFDTFSGMTEPSEVDVRSRSKEPATTKFSKNQNDGFNTWCYASLEDVKSNFLSAAVSLENVVFVKGDVLETLDHMRESPLCLSVLRLDTDWYESTLRELQILYPKLSIGGALLIDDYGHWEGARKAVDEYFSSIPQKPLLQYTDPTGRMAVKHS